MEDKRERILNKLKKLMDLKESAKQLGNEGEANAAAAGISRLLIEYNLSEEDIPTEERVKNPVVMEKIPCECKGHRGQWYMEMIATICNYNLCRPLLARIIGRRKEAEKFIIIGRKSNVDVVLYLASYLNAQFQSIGRAKYKEMCQEYREMQICRPVSQAQYMTSFLHGCVKGLNYQYEKMATSMEHEYIGTTALVVTSKKEIDSYIEENLNVTGEKKMRKHSNMDSYAYTSGVKAGSEINLQSGLYGKEESVSSIR